MTDNAKPSPAMDRFTLDPESGFVYDRENKEWLTAAEEVFNALWPLLANAPRDGRVVARTLDGVVRQF